MKPQRQCISQETKSKNSIMKSTWSSLIVEGSKHKITGSYASKRNNLKKCIPFVVKYWGCNQKNISNSCLKVTLYSLYLLFNQAKKCQILNFTRKCKAGDLKLSKYDWTIDN